VSFHSDEARRPPVETRVAWVEPRICCLLPENFLIDQEIFWVVSRISLLEKENSCLVTRISWVEEEVGRPLVST
jgi:Tfp pilus assembly protein PilZ